MNIAAKLLAIALALSSVSVFSRDNDSFKPVVREKDSHGKNLSFVYKANKASLARIKGKTYRLTVERHFVDDGVLAFSGRPHLMARRISLSSYDDLIKSPSNIVLAWFAKGRGSHSYRVQEKIIQDGKAVYTLILLDGQDLTTDIQGGVDVFVDGAGRAKSVVSLCRKTMKHMCEKYVHQGVSKASTGMYSWTAEKNADAAVARCLKSATDYYTFLASSNAVTIHINADKHCEDPSKKDLHLFEAQFQNRDLIFFDMPSGDE